MDLRRLDRAAGGLEALNSFVRPKDAGLWIKDRISRLELNQLPPEAQDLIVNEAAPAVEAAFANQPLNFKAQMAVEALVRVDGRPALEVRNGETVLNTPEAGHWSQLISDHAPALKTVFAAVGRIDLRGAHVGTGFLVGPNLVLTNRHVAEVIAKAFAKPSGDVWLMKAGEPTIDFNREIDATARSRFRIVRIVRAGLDPIDMEVDPTKLDAALLEIDPQGIDGGHLAAPLNLLDPASLANDDPGEIVSVGYPGAPGYEPKGPVPSSQERKVMAALKRIFNMTYGVKRISPGEIMVVAGGVPDGGRRWVFTHDATTLGGASGSCVIRLSGGEARVIGLHFGGAWLKHNFAHLTARLKEPLLSDSSISWRL